ncbi:MAG: HPP family protein [Ktedonobacteraceae bacterium]|nr:HPP family protein [Ktedonobacteraceae bacterium]
MRTKGAYPEPIRTIRQRSVHHVARVGHYPVRIFSVWRAVSPSCRAGLMVLCKSPHPPAGATTLIISLGILTQPWQLVLLLVAVVILTIQAFAINRLAGIPYPLWNPIKEQEAGPGQRG